MPITSIDPPSFVTRARRWGAIGVVMLAVAVLLPLAAASQPASDPPTPARVRVPTSHANVHMGPSSGQQLLVMVSRDTVLEVLGRNKEWLQVRLTPEMRKTGIVMRWYKNEDSGWMHDSTVESVEK